MPTSDAKTQATLINFNLLPDSTLVRMPVVLGLFSCSRATVWRWVRDGRFPAPKKIGGRMSAWVVGELRHTLKAIIEGNGIPNSLNVISQTASKKKARRKQISE